jgi:hypothetical protein
MIAMGDIYDLARSQAIRIAYLIPMSAHTLRTVQISNNNNSGAAQPVPRWDEPSEIPVDDLESIRLDSACGKTS